MKELAAETRRQKYKQTDVQPSFHCKIEGVKGNKKEE